MNAVSGEKEPFQWDCAVKERRVALVSTEYPEHGVRSWGEKLMQTEDLEIYDVGGEEEGKRERMKRESGSKERNKALPNPEVHYGCRSILDMGQF